MSDNVYDASLRNMADFDAKIEATPASRPIPGQGEATGLSGVDSYVQARRESMAKLAGMAEDPEAFMRRWDAAESLALVFAKTPEEIFPDLDTYAKDYFGKSVAPETLARSVRDSFVAGIESVKMGKDLAAYVTAKYLAPKLGIDLGGVIDPEAALARAMASQEKMDALNVDITPRAWYENALKWTASAIPYTADVAASAAIGGGIAKVAGGAIEKVASRVALNAALKGIGQGVAATAATAAKPAVITTALKGFIVGSMQFAESQKIMMGLDFKEMLDQGIEEETAAFMSVGTSAVEAAIEQFVGIESGYAKLFSGGATKNVTEAVMKRAFVKGAFATAAAKVAPRVALNTVAEGSEEALQEAVKDLGIVFAQGIMEAEGSPVTDPLTAGEIGRGIATAFVQGMAVAPILGLPLDVAMTVKDHKAAAKLAAAAPTMGKDSFFTLGQESGVVSSLKPEDQKAVLETMWQNARVKRLAERMEGYKDAVGEAAKRQDAGAVAVRTAAGALRVEEAAVVDSDSSARTFTAGSAKGVDRYADIVVEERDGKNVIVDADVVPGHEDIVRELLVEAATRIGNGKPLVVAEGISPDVEAAYEWVKANNPRGQGFGASWSDGTAAPEAEQVRNLVRNEALKVNYMDAPQREVFVGLFDLLAKSTPGGYKTLGAKIQPGFLSVDPALDAAGKAGKIEFLDEAGAALPIAEAARAARAVITLAEGGNFAAVVHEFGHFSRQALRETPEMRAIEAEYGIVDGKWETAHDERFTNDLMRFLSDGTVANEAARPLFEKIAAWLKTMWKGALEKLDLAPKVREAFEAWFSRQDEVKAESGLATGAAEEEAPLSLQDDSDRADSGEDVYEDGRREFKKIEAIKVADIVNTPNVKEGADPETGEVTPIEGDWNQDVAGAIDLHRRADGKLYMISGRHRYQSARRANAEVILARVYDEKDGFTEAHAAVLDAENNIRDNQGSVRDFAKHFRRIGYDEREAARRGLLRGDRQRQGFHIGRYASENLYALYLGRKIAGDVAATIARIARGDKDLEAYGIANKGLDPDLLAQNLLSYADRLTTLRAEAGQGDLFASDEEIQAEIQRQVIADAQMNAAAAAMAKEIRAEYEEAKRALGATAAAAKIKAAGGDVDNVDPAVLRSEMANLEAKYKLLSTIDWRHDTLLRAEVKRRAGMDLTADEEAAIAVATDLSDAEKDGTYSLFMGSDELKAGGTDSPEFKAWFGDSKVVDEDGNPLVVYHGTTVKDIDIFKSGDNRVDGNGIYFTSSEEVAESYSGKSQKATIMSVYLSFKSPLVIDARGGYWGDLSNAKVMGSDGKESPWTVSQLFGFQNSFTDRLAAKVRSGSSFDGIIIKNVSDQGPKTKRKLAPSTVYIALKPEQIKSVNNRGTWDASDPRILYMSKNELSGEPTASAKDYATAEEWMANLGDVSTFSEEDKAWFRRRFDFEHSGKKRKFERKGDFAAWLAERGGKGGYDYPNLSAFLTALDAAINTRGDDYDRHHAKRVLDAISKTPEIKSIIDAYAKSGKAPSLSQLSRLAAFVRKNEAITKFLYAEVLGDIDLADEALSDMEAVPEIKKREFVSIPGMTLADQAFIIEDIQDEEIKRRIADKSISMEELLEYAKRVEKRMEAEYGDIIASARSEARLGAKILREQSRAAQREIRAYYREKEAIRKMNEYVRRMRKYIMARPSSRISLAERSAILLVQSFFASGGKIEGQKELFSLGFAMSPGVLAETKAFLSAFEGRELKDLTGEEILAVAKFVKNTADAGRILFRNDELVRDREYQRLRKESVAAFEGSRYYKESLTPGSVEKKDSEEKARKFRSFSLAAIMPHAFLSKYLDGGSNGWHFNKLFVEKNRAEARKFSYYDRRTAPVIEFIESRKLHKTIFREIALGDIGVNDTAFNVTASGLVGIRALIGTRDRYNQAQREALIYGTLFSEDEKDADGNLRMEDENAPAGDEYLRGKYEAKLEALLKATDELLTEDEKALADLMVEATNDDNAWDRFAVAMYRITGKEPKKEKNYFPILRQGIMAQGEDEIVDKIRSSGTFHNIGDTGLAIERKAIKPKNQKPIQYDAMKVFFDAVMKQEHLSNMGLYLQEVNGVYFNGVFSGSIKEKITSSLGQSAWKYLEDYVETLTTPASFKHRDIADEPLSLVRGLQVIGNLSWRLSSVAMQLGTSPLPFLVEVSPGELLKVAAEAWTSGNPVQWYKGIEKKSASIKNRQYDPYELVLKELGETGMTGVFKRFSQAGMSGLSFADRLSVAIGWEALYRREVARRSQEAKLDEITDPVARDEAALTIDQAARGYADDFVKRTQPSAEDSDRSPLFRNMNSFKQVILQFQQPLNVVWNNLSVDMPLALRERQMSKVFGYMGAYAMTGLVIGLTRALRGRGPDEDDEDEGKWVRFFLLSAGGQFTDAIPLIGEAATSLTEGAFTGRIPFRRDDNMPLVSTTLEALSPLTRWAELDADQRGKAAGKSLLAFGEVVAMSTGLPWGAAENTVKLGAQVFGEE